MKKIGQSDFFGINDRLGSEPASGSGSGSGAGGSPSFAPSFAHESHMASLLGCGIADLVGVDEVGRGPLAGPVVAAAVMLDPDRIPIGLNDSKRLSAKKRAALYDQIQTDALAISIAEASVDEIDEINILQASMLAMRRAVAGLSQDMAPQGVLVDGNHDPGLAIPARMLVKGDARSLSVAAASVIAKVFRDRLMEKLGETFPDYGWGQNAGYGVRAHLEAIELVGVCEHHRKSFAPIRKIIA